MSGARSWSPCWVGTILNLINQGDALVAGAALSWWKIALTYVVPFCVATYGACSMALIAAARAADEPGREGAAGARG